MKTVSKKLLSLLLVAILLVSAIPFQAFADEHPADNSGLHTLSALTYDASAHAGGTHWQECTKADCDWNATTPKHKVGEVNHVFGADGVCACGFVCDHKDASGVDHTGPDASSAIAATCLAEGKTANTVCLYCGKLIAEGTPTPKAAHDYGTDPFNNTCLVCKATKKGAQHKLTLNPNEGTIGGLSTSEVTVYEGEAIDVLPDASRDGFNFVGWFIGDTQISLGTPFRYNSDQTAVARWSQQTQLLTVRRVLNGDNSTAKTIYTANVPAGTSLLTYLNANVASIVTTELASTPGYRWQDSFWFDYSGTQPLTTQNDKMNQAQTVYVNFVSNSYTLYFNANGGSVTPTSKAVTFGSAVGTLPTPYREGYVFMGWKDTNGNVYTADTVYNVAGDTSLTAVWQDEALVILYIYINGDFSTCNRMIAMDGFVKNNNISRSDVFAEVSKYYAPASGTLKIAGLFDEYTWGSYRSNTNKAGTENIQIGSARPNKIYVMVSNASTGTTVIPTTPTTPTNPTVPTVPSNGFWVRDLNGNLVWYPAGSPLPSGSGYWILDANGNPNIWVITSGSIIPTYIYTGSNPKTGDTAQIEIAAAVMVLAAAALITVMALRKKKSV